MSGAIVGSVFYIIGFPMLVWTLAEPVIVTPFGSMAEILPNFKCITRITFFYFGN
jgi:hypothetical protein